MKLFYLVVMLSFNTFAKDSLKQILDKSFERLNVKKISVIQKEILENRLKLEKLSEPIEISGAIGDSIIGDYNGAYNEIEISYKMELSGERRFYKSKILPLLTQLNQYDSMIEANEIKFSVIKMFVAYGISQERFKHAIERKENLQKIIEFLRNNKQKSPQALANKELIRQRIEDIEFEMHALKIELEATDKILSLFLEKSPAKILRQTSPKAARYKEVYSQIQSVPSQLKNYLDHRYELLKTEQDLSKKTWIPDLRIYAGQNVQGQPGADPQEIRYIGLGISIPTELSYKKKQNIAKAKLQIEQIRQKRVIFDNAHQEGHLQTMIKNKVFFLHKNNENAVREKEEKLKIYFRSLAKGLVSLQTYLELDSVIHERYHTVLDYKISLMDDFYRYLNLKKQPVDQLGEILWQD